MGVQEAESPSQIVIPDSAPPPQTTYRASLLKSSPAFALLAVIAVSAENFVNPSLWREILSGRLILQTGNPHLHDIFSYTAYGLPIHDHEWLAQVAMAVFYNAMGVRGLLALKLLCAGAFVVFLALALAETGASAPVQRVVLIVTALGLASNFQFRPQLFTLVLLALEMALLARQTFRATTRALWLMVPAFALWVNLHGGFMAGLGAMGVFAVISGFLDLRRSGSWRRFLSLSAVTGACALATLANPSGIHAWTMVLSSVGNSTWHKAMIDWQPVFRMIAFELKRGSALSMFDDMAVPFAFFAALTVFIVVAPSWEDAGLVGVCAVFIAATFHTWRFAPLAEIVIAVPLAYRAELFFARRAAAGKSRAPDSGFNPIVAAALIVMLVWAGGLASSRLRMGALRYPVGAVRFMNGHGLHGNILSNFRWSTYLMWHMSPRSRIFIDERAEILYPDKILKQYLRFYLDRPGAEKVLNQYPTQFVMVPPNSKADGVVARNRNWKLIYRDNIAALFARVGSTAASEFRSPVHGNSPRGVFP